MMLADFSAPLRLIGHNLAIRRGSRSLFAKLDFTLSSNEIMQLTGPNGSGKSTLMRIIAGFLAVDAGEVTLAGHDETRERSAFFHYCGHREGMREALSVRENLAFAAGLLGRSTADIPAALERVGVASLIDLPVQVLSAGQRRRASLAKLLLAPRPIWLLDEPFTALDSAGRGLIATVIAEHAKAGGMALVATHQDLPYPTRSLSLGPAQGRVAA